MTDDHASDVKKHLKTYIGVFVALLVLTVVTVAVSNLKVGIAVSVAIALVIATVKGSLVGAFFMHLAWEKRSIWSLIIMAGGLFLTMIALFIWSFNAPLAGTEKPPIEAAASQNPGAESH